MHIDLNDLLERLIVIAAISINFSNAFLFKYIQLALSKYGKYAGIILKQISIRTLRFEHMKTLRGLAEIPLLLELRKHQDIKYRCYNYLVGSLAI